MVPLELKSLNDVESFKSEIKNMSAIYAHYRLCEYQ